MLPAMFVVTEADAAAIRTAYEQEGELSVAIEVRRLFPGDRRQRRGAGMRPDHRRVETAARSGLSDYLVTPSWEPGSDDEALIGTRARQCTGADCMAT
jgi:hypothetical protein